MSDETNTQNNFVEDADFAFVIARKDGNFAVNALPGKEGSTDDLYNACWKICRNIDSQQNAQQVAAAMAQMAMELQNSQQIVTPTAADLANLRKGK